MSQAAIQVEQLSKRYLVRQQRTERYATLRESVSQFFAGASQVENAEEFWALQDVSFAVQQGEVLGIIGQNGAGKSTLLKLISQITEPTNGRIRITGRLASLLEVGTGFHPELTGRENIYFNGAILGMSRTEIRAKFNEIVEFAGVERFLDTPVKRYSSGMYLRLAFAVAAHLEAEILILDEILAVGDAEFQRRCMGKMTKLAKESGRAVLFVSHNLAAVQNLCSRALLLSSGRVVQDGPANEVIARYAGSNMSTSHWTRPSALTSTGFLFESLTLNLEGKQPSIRLAITCIIIAPSSSEAAFVAFDIRDAAGIPLMQALPRPEPFIKTGDHRVRLVVFIDLPPMVPGSYNVDAWLGPHFSQTYDYQSNVVSFEITESPTLGRSFPHTSDHGAIVPNSSIMELAPA